MSKRWVLMLGALAATPAMAQDNAPQRLITVVGVGVDRTEPDVATLDFSIRGEGDDADMASSALAKRQKALTDGVAGLLGAGTDVTTSSINVTEVRDRACNDARVYGQAQLSRGACAVVGYVATMQAQVRTRAVDKAGTAVGLAVCLGASDARISSFSLMDPEAAQQRAVAIALKDARHRAEAAASGASVKLGAVITIRDPGLYSPDNIVVTARRAVETPSAPPPPPPPPPVPIGVKPRPIETRAQMNVSYAIGQ